MSNIYDSVFEGNTRKVERLLQGGLFRRKANPNDSRPPMKYLLLDGVVTPLDLAIERADIEVVKILLKYGANPNLVFAAAGYMKPYVRAILTYQPKILKILLETGINSSRQGLLEELLEIAIKDAITSIKLPLDFPWDLRKRLITEIVDLLLQHGADWKEFKFYEEGRRYKDSALASAAYRGLVGVIRLLLERGVDVNEQDHGGRTALHAAARGKDLEIVQILLEAKADVNIKDKFGRTALSEASDRSLNNSKKGEERDKKIVDLLRRSGAN